MKRAAIFFIVLGAIGLGINMVFGMETFSFMEKVRITGSLFSYKLDTYAYLQNVKTNITNVSAFQVELFTRQWGNGDNNWDKLLNNLAFIVDIIILLTNFVLFPFRVGGYIIMNIFALLGIKTGINQGGGLKWLINVARFLRDLQIPYI